MKLFDMITKRDDNKMLDFAHRSAIALNMSNEAYLYWKEIELRAIKQYYETSQGVSVRNPRGRTFG